MSQFYIHYINAKFRHNLFHKYTDIHIGIFWFTVPHVQINIQKVHFNTSKPGFKNGHHFADDISKWISSMNFFYNFAIPEFYFLNIIYILLYTDSKAHVANTGPTLVLSVPDGPHVSPMNLAIRVYICSKMSKGNGIIFKAWMVFNKTTLYHFVTHWYSLMSVTVFMYGVKHMTHLNLSCCMGNCWTTAHTNVHDDVIKWKHFLHYWPFVLGIHRSPVNSPHKGQWRIALMFSFIYA